MPAPEYNRARAKWFSAGKPWRSQPEQQRILLVCLGCRYYRPQECVYPDESCNVKPPTFGDLIGWDTTWCPAEKW